MTATLGHLMKDYLARQEHNAVSTAARLELEKSEKAAAEFQTVLEFFKKAKAYFTKCIQDEKPLKAIGIVVGRKPTGPSENEAVYTLLQMYSSNPAGKLGTKGTRFYPLWVEMCNWAAENGLELVWREEHDGVGVHSWQVFTIKPAV